ncbi:MAG TPA: hypothetical protein VHB73_01945, partial [Alphaproteobacteria bacterium]|nr:hypothetical protein [Alphaproteobacteria bacterium]
MADNTQIDPRYAQPGQLIMLDPRMEFDGWMQHGYTAGNWRRFNITNDMDNQDRDALIEAYKCMPFVVASAGNIAPFPTANRPHRDMHSFVLLPVERNKIILDEVVLLGRQYVVGQNTSGMLHSRHGSFLRYEVMETRLSLLDSLAESTMHRSYPLAKLHAIYHEAVGERNSLLFR